MAKKAVVEIQCDRCPRREYMDPETTKTQGPTTVTFSGNTIVFNDLCSACYSAVASHVEAIARKLDGRSPERAAKTKKPTPEGVSLVAPVDKPPVDLISKTPTVDLASRSPSGPRAAGPRTS